MRGLKQGLVARMTALLLIAMFVAAPVEAGRDHADIDNIGNRKISGNVFGIFPNFFSLEREIQMGRQLAQEFEQSAKLYNDPAVNQYISELASRLVAKSDAKVPFVIKVVDTDEPNAFALPGGFLYVNKGLLALADNESEVAGVIAHEISHVAARHATRMFTKAQVLQFASIPAMFLTGGLGSLAQQGIYNALGLSINLGLLGVSRGSEREADQLGIQYLWNAGYDPLAFLTFFEKMQAREKEKPGRFSGFFRTHPPADDRIAKASEEVEFLPARDEYVMDTSEFQQIKAAILAADNARPRDSDEKRPTLRRKTERPAEVDSEPDKPRPTLKRGG